MPPRIGKVRNGGQRHGLWRWSAGGVVLPAELDDNPRVRPCPTCGAAEQRACRRRRSGGSGYAAMIGYHPARRES